MSAVHHSDLINGGIAGAEKPKHSEITANKNVTTYKASIPEGTSPEQVEKVVGRLK